MGKSSGNGNGVCRYVLAIIDVSQNSEGHDKKQGESNKGGLLNWRYQAMVMTVCPDLSTWHLHSIAHVFSNEFWQLVNLLVLFLFQIWGMSKSLGKRAWGPQNLPKDRSHWKS